MHGVVSAGWQRASIPNAANCRLGRCMLLLSIVLPSLLLPQHMGCPGLPGRICVTRSLGSPGSYSAKAYTCGTSWTRPRRRLATR